MCSSDLTFREEKGEVPRPCPPTEIPPVDLIPGFIQKMGDLWQHREKIASFCGANPGEAVKKLEKVLQEVVDEEIQLFLQKEKRKTDAVPCFQRVIWGQTVEIACRDRKEIGYRQKLLIEAILDVLSGFMDCAPEIVGEAPSIYEIKKLIRQTSWSDLCVLITGETGSGKELIARAIHSNSKRSAGPFLAFNCACFNEELAGSELFGHVEGAFTGACRDKEGLFEAADGGTVFLDEIGDMPFKIQAKMLRVLDNQEITRVGENITRTVDVRVISATNQNLRQLVAEGKFREDLYYRIKGIEITTPALRERKEDVPLLARYFLQQESQSQRRTLFFHPRALAVLQSFPWPGNVRELKNVVSVLALAQNEEIEESEVDDLLRKKQENHGFLQREEGAEDVSTGTEPGDASGLGGLKFAEEIGRVYRTLDEFFGTRGTLNKSQYARVFQCKDGRWQIKKLIHWGWLEKTGKEGEYRRGPFLGRYFLLDIRCHQCGKVAQVNNFNISLENLSGASPVSEMEKTRFQ